MRIQAYGLHNSALIPSTEPLKIEIEIGLEFNQSERKPISSLMNSALIGQNPIQSQS